MKPITMQEKETIAQNMDKIVFDDERGQNDEDMITEEASMLLPIVCAFPMMHMNAEVL